MGEVPLCTSPHYRGVLHIRKRLPLGPYSRPVSMVLQGYHFMVYSDTLSVKTPFQWRCPILELDHRVSWCDFQRCTTREPRFSREIPSLFVYRKFASSIHREGKRSVGDIFYFRNQKRVGSLKKNKKLFDMGWVFLFFLRKFSKSGRGSLQKKKLYASKTPVSCQNRSSRARYPCTPLLDASTRGAERLVF